MEEEKPAFFFGTLIFASQKSRPKLGAKFTGFLERWWIRCFYFVDVGFLTVSSYFQNNWTGKKNNQTFVAF